MRRHTEEWRTAYDLSRALARDCADLLIWEPIAKFALEGALQAHRNLKLAKDEEWANIATAYLRVRASSKEGVSALDGPAGQEADMGSEIQLILGGLKEIEVEHTGELAQF